MAAEEDDDASETVPGRPSKFLLEFFSDEAGSPVVLEWLRGLTLTKKQVLGTAMREVLQELGVDVCGTEFGRQLGQGLFEFRVRQKAGDVRRQKGRGRRLPCGSSVTRSVPGWFSSLAPTTRARIPRRSDQPGRLRSRAHGSGCGRRAERPTGLRLDLVGFTHKHGIGNLEEFLDAAPQD